MLKSLLVMAFALFGTIATVQAETPALDHSSKPTVAVFYADWCGSCKILEPNMMKAMEEMENKDMLNVVKFDLTDDATKATSAAMAGENGLTDLYNAHAPKTGFAALVKDGKAVMKITKTDSVEVIKAKLETFIALQS